MKNLLKLQWLQQNDLLIDSLYEQYQCSIESDCDAKLHRMNQPGSNLNPRGIPT